LLSGEVGSIVEEAMPEEGVQYLFVLTQRQTRTDAAIVFRAGSAASSHEPGSEAPGQGVPDRPVWRWHPACRALTIANGTGLRAGEVRAARALGAEPFHDADDEAPRKGHSPARVIEANLREAGRLLGRPLRAQDRRARVERGMGTAGNSTGRRNAVQAGSGLAWVDPRSLDRRSALGSREAMAAGMAVVRATAIPSRPA
jgi:hypothetical protein